MRTNVLLAAIGLAAPLFATAAEAGAVLDAVRARGELICGTRGDTQGFARRDNAGKYSGIEVDMCRAVAVAIFGNAEKVKYVPLEPAKRFSTLQEGGVDMLASGTTYTLTRDTTLGLDFVGIYYFDTQAFMAPRKLGKKSVRDITSASVCVQAGTTTLANVEDYFRNNNMTFKPVVANSADEMRVAFFAGRCDLLAADRSAVYASRAAYASNPNDYLILPESASREPLGLIVRQGDRPFAEVVRWSLYAMIQAEELGVTSRNVDEMLKSANPNISLLLGVAPGTGAALKIDDKWAYNIIKQVGNYGESYARNVGGPPLHIPRGLNALASQGGMQYAPPIR
ncbi:MAG TPA: amino acid ABC transporter substrate-binding protein [Reyranella sp.]|jgi:general L-amino acid transport system substrate-binding protein|nr:amino acid ABC transporter substrate-binding protein [Reyranella sp.]